MKYSSQEKQYRLDLFSIVLEKSLDPSNRWYKLAGAMLWDEIERVYNKCLHNKHCGGGNKPARIIVGALIIKHKMYLSDKETVQIISENPHMQYFVGIEEFTSKPVFDSSLFVFRHIRAAGKPLGRPSKEMQTEEYKLQSAKDMGKRNEAKSTFETGKRVYNANDVRAKLPDTADVWTAACFLAKNAMKFLKGLLWLLFEKSKLSLGKKFLMIDRIFFHSTAHSGMSMKVKME